MSHSSAISALQPELPPHHSGEGAEILSADSGSSLHIPGGNFLLTAEFHRVGGDLLLTGDGGHDVVVQGYFNSHTPPDLISGTGGVISGDLAARLAGPIAPGQYALDGSAAPDSHAIGQVQNLSGTVTVHHANGVSETLHQGSTVFQGDVMQTAGDGTVGLVFADRSTFSLGKNGRMVMDEMVYDPQAHNGHSTMSVVQGTFSFVSGQIAKSAPDAMHVKTPVMTIGIRGTTVAGVAAAEGSQNTVALLSDADGGVGQIIISTQGGPPQVMTIPNQSIQISSAFEAPPPLVILRPDQLHQIMPDLHNVQDHRPPPPTSDPHITGSNEPNGTAPTITDPNHPTGTGDHVVAGLTGDHPTLAMPEVNDVLDQAIAQTTQALQLVNNAVSMALHSSDNTGGTGSGALPHLDTHGGSTGTLNNDVTGQLTNTLTQAMAAPQHSFTLDAAETNDLYHIAVSNSSSAVTVDLTHYQAYSDDTTFTLSSTALNNDTASVIFADNIDSDVLLASNFTHSLIVSLSGNHGTINTGSGNDIVSASGSWTTVDGGAGHDVLAASGSHDTLISGGDDGSALISSGSHNTLLGSAGADTLIGHGDSDSLFGGLGNDLFISNGANNHINGGGGTDSLSYENLSGGITADLLHDTIVSANGTDSYSGIASLTGSTGNDLFLSDGANHHINGGGGTDSLSYENLSGGITADLLHDTIVSANGTDSFSGIETVFGTDHGDTLIGGDVNTNQPTASLIQEVVVGHNANTIIDLNYASPVYAGHGEGTSLLVDYERSATGVTIDLSLNDSGNGSEITADGTIVQMNGVAIHDGTADTLYGVTAVEGSIHNDTLIGSTFGTFFKSSLGDDSYVGNSDAVSTNAGDVLSYYDSSSAAVINLSDSTQIVSLTLSSGATVSVTAAMDTALHDITSSSNYGNDSLDNIEVVELGYHGGEVIGNGSNTWLNLDKEAYDASTGLTVDLSSGHASGWKSGVTDVFLDLAGVSVDSGTVDFVIDNTATLEATSINGGTGASTLDFSALGGSAVLSDHTDASGHYGTLYLLSGSTVVYSDIASLVGTTSSLGAVIESFDMNGYYDLSSQSGNVTADLAAHLLYTSSASEWLLGGYSDAVFQLAHNHTTTLKGTVAELSGISTDGNGAAVLEITNGGVISDSIFTDGSGGYKWNAHSLVLDAASTATLGTDADYNNGYYSVDLHYVHFANSSGNSVLDASGFTNDLTVVLTGGDNTVIGGSGHNIFYGGNGIDTLIGGATSDTLVAGSGAETLDGGGGTNTLEFTASSSGVTVDLVHGTAGGSGIGHDSIANFEVIGGSSHNDLFYGTGSGGASFIGNGGTDVLSYSEAATAVTFDLSNNEAITTDGTDRFSGIYNLTGSSADDLTIANAAQLQGGVINFSSGWTNSYTLSSDGFATNLSGSQDSSGIRHQVFSYSENFIGDDSWTMTTAAAAQTGAEVIHWDYSGFHSWFEATASISYVVNGVTTLLAVNGAENIYGDTDVTGGFDWSGNLTLDLTAGQAVTFILTGGEEDGTAIMRSTLDLSEQLYSLNGGSGVNTLELSGHDITDNAFAHVTNYQVLETGSATTVTLGSYADAAGIHTVDLTTDSSLSLFDASNTTGDITVTGPTVMTSDETYIGGSGNDSFVVNIDGMSSFTDTIIGDSTAINTLVSTATATLSDNAFAHVSHVSVLDVDSAWTVTLGAYADAAGISTVDLSADSALSSFDASGSNNNLYITATTNQLTADSLIGGSGTVDLHIADNNASISSSAMAGHVGNIDAIDLGTNADTLTLNSSNLSALLKSTNSVTGTEHSLVVTGSSASSVNLVATVGNWVNSGSVTETLHGVTHSYTIYDNATANEHVYVDSNITNVHTSVT